MRLLGSSQTTQATYSIRWLSADGIRDYTAKEFETRVDFEKKALSQIGIRPGTKVGIRGDNSFLWMVSDVALAELGAVSVVFPAEFNDHALEDLISTYGLSFCLLSDAAPKNGQTRSDVATMGQIDPNRHKTSAVENDPYPVTDDDHSFVFSSGTSGAFKGMVISQKGILDQVETFCDALGITGEDCMLLFMPFSSLQNRVMYYGGIMRNLDIVVAPSTQLLDGLKQFRPTFLVAPPIFYEAVEKSIKAALARTPAVARIALFIASALARTIRIVGGTSTSSRLLHSVYAKAHAVFGGRMRVMVTGMAKIGPSTLEFYESLGLPLVQVYGLTECGVVCVNTLSNNQIGTVGRPLAGNTISIADDGEIVVHKDAPQTSRFFHFEESSEDTRFEGGGVYTGDLGHLSEDGTLTLVGRKKSTIVGHSGVKVQPEPIEKVLEESMLISKAVLVGLDNGRSLGIVLQTTRRLTKPELAPLENDARNIVGSMATSFKDHLRLSVCDEDFTTENGLLTRNLKINRHAVRARFFEGAPAA
ncbi:MAG: AMP-binding protein [Alphaproteobacteria bacterium]|nr:AMP-binding protein [Alphaproteobacteria bacterium]